MMENYSNNVRRQHVFLKEDHKLMVRDVNSFFICTLCRGYLVDATGLVECAHIYCRSCIIQFLKINFQCPVCEVSLNKEDPFLSLRSDQIMQRLVYKAIPGLYKKELLQRKLYFDNSEVDSIIISDDESTTKQHYFDPKEPISICLEYIESSRTEEIFNSFDEIGNRNHSYESLSHASHKRYLQCPAALRIKTLLKWIREKYSLRKNHEVEILYNKIKLPNYFSIMDIAYTFLWKRESPMCLGYQIFKQSLIKIPSNLTNTILNGNIPTENNLITKTRPLDTSSVEEKSFKYATNFENMSRNLKYKSNTGNIGKISNTSEFEFSEPTVKIPRISSSLLDEEMNEIKSTESKCLKNDSPRLENRALSNDSALYLDDYKYEQDIEEIVDDGDNENEEDNDNNDDEDDRLHILDLPDDKHEDMSQQLIIDTSDEGREEKLEDKKTKNKRKNKKSKHHKHHHRRHERKRGAPQATILHSPDTDIMKLKVKLNNVKPEIRYNKQSHKRWKKSPDTYFSTSSNCSESSILPSSPDTNGTCKADEELIQSQVFELSDENSATFPIKEDKSIKISKEQKEEILKEPIACGKNITIESSANKEKLLQMRAFRPKNIAVVKPEENDKTSAILSKNDNNDDNNNNEVPAPIFEVNSSKTGSGILHPASSSSITVSKITAAEKLLMEQEKKMNNSNNNAKPSLEITLVTEPLKMMAGSVPATSLCMPNQHKNNQLSHRMMKPVPPLYHLAVRSNEVNRSKAPSVQPYMRQMPLSPSQSTSTQSNTYISNFKKKVNDGITAIKPDGMKQSVTISLSGNVNSKDSSSALNLSNKPLFSHSIANLTSSEPSKLHVKSNELITPPTNIYNPISNISSLTENMNLHKYSAANIPHRRHMIGYPIISTIQNNDRISCPSILHKPQAVTYPITNKISKTTNIPPLNEIRLGPASTLEVLPKPRQNQSVRNIPNPSHVRRKYNPYSTITVNPVISQTTSESIEVSMMRHLASTSCSLSNYKEVVGKCSPVIPKSCMEHTNIMITK